MTRSILFHSRSGARPGLRTRALRTAAVGLCLTSCLTGVVACSSDGEGSDNASSSGTSGTLGTASERPSITAGPTASTSATPGTLGTRDPNATAKPTDSWTPPEIHFYNENWDYWYQDDAVTNQDSITSRGNLEGYRTYVGRCVGYATRDISEATRFSGLSDETMSNTIADGSTDLDSFTETSRERVSLVTDDGGTLEGYNVTYTGTYTWADGASEVHGYRFARAVGSSGLRFVVMLMCSSDSDLTLDQWHEILAGIRLTGVSGGAME